MENLNKAALLLILVGMVIIVFAVLQSLPTIQTPSIAGGAVIFIGPIPIFLGWGAPAELILMLVILMVIFTLLGFILFRSAKRT